MGMTAIIEASVQATGPIVGSDRPRLDAIQKVTGRASYTVDVRRPGMLHAKVLRSPHAHARILGIDTSDALALEGVEAVLTGDDVRQLAKYGSFVKDQAVLALDVVRYVGDPVAAVAAVDERTASAALDLIRVEYEILPAVFDIKSAMDPESPLIHADRVVANVPHYGPGTSGFTHSAHNVNYEFRYETGPESVWDECDHIFEDTFTFGRMNHMHLEPFVSVAEATDEQIEIWTSTQAPFQIRLELSGVFGLPDNKVRVHAPMLGGGFGAKHGPHAEAIAIGLSQRANGRPVRFCMTTEEVFLSLTQHEAILTLTTGVNSDGEFIARNSRVWLNSGAYADLSPLVVEKAGYRMAGAYRWKRIDSICQGVVTNTVPAGAFRGFGGTQASWASERQVDLVAERLGMSPFELRLKNLKDLGEAYVPGETPVDSDLKLGLNLVADTIGYKDRQRTPGRGMGVAIGMKDGGGVNKPAQARVKISSNGSVFLNCALTEMGQGGHSAMCQIVAEVLGCEPVDVTYAAIDTDNSPYCQGTNASSGIAVMGRAVRQAAEKAKRAVLDYAAEQLDRESAELSLVGWSVEDSEGVGHPLKKLVMQNFGALGFEFIGEGFFKATRSTESPLEAPCVFWEIGWAAAEVDVDLETGKVTLLQLVVSGDAGKVINKIGCRGQDEGAAVFGLGQALFEELRFEDGVLLNAEALLYRVPLAEDIPETFTSITQAQGHGGGPFGAKGMGEGTMLPIAPAIAQAVADATGAQLTGLPMTPQRVYMALQAVGNDSGAY